jgi:hypothetical protein
MMKKKLYKSKSNFTLKRLHQSGSYGKIFERDYTTIPNTDTPTNSQIITYSSPTFKLSVGKHYNTQKKYKYGDWLINPVGCGDNPEHWRMDCLPVIRKQANKIVLKPHKKRLSDYACYGSATDLIRYSISNIIEHFPGELFTSATVYKDGYIISNPFEIDLISAVMPEGSNPLRYMCESYGDYVIINGTTETPVTTWKVSYAPDKSCLADGDLLATITLDKHTIKAYYNKGEVIYTCKNDIGRIRPNKEVIENFFDELGDFERALLDRESGYVAVFETYYEDDEEGWLMTERQYKWPRDSRYAITMSDKWNLATFGKGFEDYLSDLLELATAYDTLFTDNIWKSMTHEAITNLDLTFNRNNTEVGLMGGSKMRKVLSVIGRQFDEIKKYADGITCTNSVSYDENGNLPDYFLSDSLELSGWEPKDMFTGVDGDLVTDPIYKGVNYHGYNVQECNNAFMRRLKLNSKYVFAQKGTKKGIEDLMAHFGYHTVDWIQKYMRQNGVALTNPYQFSFIMQEYVYVANGYGGGMGKEEVLEKTAEYNAYRDSLNNENIENMDYVYDPYVGLPVAMIDNGELSLIPWFDKSVKYDGDVYFQMYGGWGFYVKTQEDPTATETYDRTRSKIHFFNTEDDLYSTPPYVLNENDVYYVKEKDQYYKLSDITKSYDANGWVECDENTVKLLSLIQDNNKGNNPHVDNEKNYDDGVTYLNAYESIFKFSEFSNLRMEDIEKAKAIGFKTQRVEDNTKCKYYRESATGSLDGASLRSGKMTPSSYWGSPHSELGAVSVMNNKLFRIIFDITHKDFVINEILPYLKQIIPSTAIFSYGFQSLGENIEIEENAVVVASTCDGNLCPVNGIV